MTPTDPELVTRHLRQREEWYRLAARPLGELPRDADGDEPPQEYVYCGDLAQDAADDVSVAIAALDAARQRDAVAEVRIKQLEAAVSFWKNQLGVQEARTKTWHDACDAAEAHVQQLEAAPADSPGATQVRPGVYVSQVSSSVFSGPQPLGVHRIELAALRDHYAKGASQLDADATEAKAWGDKEREIYSDAKGIAYRGFVMKLEELVGRADTQEPAHED